jgi:soluble calcium-activated nucleotidase 1
VVFIQVYQRWAIADGDGEKVKPCKIEWATVKDGVLWVGSIGKEWTDSDGTVIHRDPEWIKTIDDAGRVQNLNWGPVYQAIRTATNTSEPGYLYVNAWWLTI